MKRAPAPKRRTKPTRRRQLAPGSTERIVTWLTVGLATRLRVHAARRRMTLSAVAEQALDAFLPPED